MFKKLERFLTKLQSSNEQTKKRWLIGLSAVSMIAVIILWLAYVNSTLNSVASPEPEEISGTGFWQVFKTGLTTIRNSLKENAGDLFSKLSEEIKKGKTITIINQNNE